MSAREAEQRRAEQARRLLEDPLMREAFAAVEAGLRERWHRDRGGWGVGARAAVAVAPAAAAGAGLSAGSGDDGAAGVARGGG